MKLTQRLFEWADWYKLPAGSLILPNWYISDSLTIEKLRSDFSQRQVSIFAIMIPLPKQPQRTTVIDMAYARDFYTIRDFNTNGYSTIVGYNIWNVLEDE